MFGRKEVVKPVVSIQRELSAHERMKKAEAELLKAKGELKRAAVDHALHVLKIKEREDICEKMDDGHVWSPGRRDHYRYIRTCFACDRIEVGDAKKLRGKLVLERDEYGRDVPVLEWKRDRYDRQ